MKEKNEWELWWNDLSKEDRKDVNQWLENNPPPDNWTYGKKAWAYTECNRGLFSNRYGSIL